MPRTVFMGSPEFALDTFRALVARYPVIGIVTQPDRPAGRGRGLAPTPVKRLALELDLPVIQARRLRDAEPMDQLRAWNPELIVVAAFGQILRPEVLELPRYGCLNVHASLLPRWRGAAPIQAALLHGDAQTGVTIMKMDPGLDTGPILSQRSLRIAAEDTAGTLAARLASLGANLLIETLPGYLAGEILPRPQEEALATFAPLLKKEEGRLDFSQPASQLARQVRAFNPWPGAFLLRNGELLKVHRAHAVVVDSPGAGIEETYEGSPAVGAAQGLLVLDEVQLAGKQPMPGKAYLHGARDWGTSAGPAQNP